MNKTVNLKLYEPNKIQREAISIINGENAPRITILAFSRQLGKAVADDSIVYTEEGEVRIDSLRVGDRIYDDKGQLTTVKEIYLHPDKEVYEVEFEDGTIVDACEDHRWGVYPKRKDYQVKTTKELMEDYLIESWKDGGTRQTFEKRYRVKLPDPINYPERELPIPPYDLGVMIGDGCLGHGAPKVSSHEDDIDETISNMQLSCKKSSSRDMFVVDNAKEHIANLGLDCNSHHKFIPDIYKYSSIEQRIELLQGLLDTDGTSGVTVEYYTVSERLAEDVNNLCKSLGLFSQKKVKNGRYLGEPHKSFRVTIRANGKFDLFKLKRKQESIRLNKKYNTNEFKRIVRIEKVDRKANMRCLLVDNQSHLFLTNGYTPTHNSFGMMMDCFEYAMNNPKSKILWVSPILDQATKVQLQLEDYFKDYPELWKMIVKKFDRKYNNIFFHNGSSIKFRSADSGDNLRGLTLHRCYIDEAAFQKEEFIQEVLFPMATQTDGRFIMASTFNGKNWFWDWYNRGLDEENWDSVRSLKRNYKDLNDPKVTSVVEAVRGSMTKAQFAQEYLCEPVSATTLFTNIESCVQPTVFIPPKNQRLFLGMDIGISQDYTVLTAIDEKYNVIDIDRFHYRESGIGYSDFKKRLLHFVHKHTKWCQVAHFEFNNNELLFDELMEDKEFARLAEPITVTPQLKPKMIDNLILLFEKEKISIPNNRDLIAELYDYGGTKSRTGKISYSNTFGKHDDMVMSLAHAAWAVTEELDGGYTSWS